MGWLGKIIGGTFGFMLGGPLGLIAGAAFGNYFDHAEPTDPNTGTQTPFGTRRQYWTFSPFTQESQQQSQMVFFVAAFSMLAKIASADGAVSDAERRKLDEFISQDLHLDQESRMAAMRIFETALASPGSFDQFAVQFYGTFRSNRQMLVIMMDILFRISYADGSISQAEETLIQAAGTIFRFTPQEVAAIRMRYTGRSGGTQQVTNPTRAYAVLGVEASATTDEIKRAYRKLVSEYHPDKIASKGLPEEFTKFAADKFREIQAAYDEIRSLKGF